MPQKILLKRGNKGQLPTLDVGEPAITLDSEEMYVGGQNGNIQIATKSDITNMEEVTGTKLEENRELIKKVEFAPEPKLNITHLLSTMEETGKGEDGIKYGWLQGFCVVNTNIVYATVSSHHYSDMAMVHEVSIDGSYKVREKLLNLGHANDMEYIPETNEIWVTPATRYDGTLEVGAEEIVVLDYPTLTIKKSVKMPTGATGIGRDPITGDIAYKHGWTVYYIDHNFNVIRTVACKKVAEDIGQGMCLYDGYIYMPRSSPESIQIWDKNGEPKKVYTLPNYTESGFYLYECESMKPVGGGRFILGVVGHRDEWLTKSVVSFFTVDIYNKSNVAKPYYSSAARLSYTGRHSRLYVDESYTKLDSDGSINKPFCDLQQAINLCNDPSIAYQIHLMPGTYGPISLNYINGSVTIRSHVTADKSSTVIEGVKIFDCANLNFLALRIKYNPVDTSLRANDSHIVLNNVDVEGIGTAGGITISNTYIWLRNGCTIKNCAYGFYLNNASIGKITSGVSFENCDTQISAVNLSICDVMPNIPLDTGKISESGGGKINWEGGV